MSASVPLKEEVAARLPWLFQDFSFRAVEERFDPGSFGNSFVTLESPALRLRFIRDRGQVFAEVAACSEPATWWNLEDVCDLISGPCAETGFELSGVAALLRSNLPALADCLGPKLSETKRELERRAEQKRLQFIRRYSP